jgi:uncharacterized protein YgiM (DUF1202 family)
MKKNLCLLLGALLTTSLIAQTNTTPPTTTPPPAKTETKAAPKKKAAAKSTAKAPAKKPVEELRTIPLVPGTASVIASNVNTRGKAGFAGEILFRINKGDTVTVIEEVKLKNSKEDEPSAWAKIALPAGAHAWVNTSFIESNKTVKPKKLNVRGGPGENYSVIGTMERGAAVKEVSVKGDWTEIEPPPGAFAFVAAQYLKQEAAPAIVTAPKPPEQPPTSAPVTEPPPVAKTTTDTAPTATQPPEPPPTPATDTTPPPSDEPPPPRIIQHEGIVKSTLSVQAPTRYALVSPQTGKTINYLYTTSTNLDLSRYKGLHIVVTGEEGLDERWVNTPIITIQRILVLE